jgi:hypothetical protein
MAFASTFELRLADGTPADPPTLWTAPVWRAERYGFERTRESSSTT